MTQGSARSATSDYRTPLITSGSGAPTSTPGKVGDMYVDTTNGGIYIAVAAAGSYNWGYVGSGAFSADYRTNLVGCWDASNGPTPAVNAGVITAWNDLSSFNNHLTGTNGVRPTFYSNVQNGLPALFFNGTNAGIGGSNLADIAQPTTQFLVFKPTGWTTGAQQEIVVMYSMSQAISKTDLAVTVQGYASGVPALYTASISNNTTNMITMICNGASSSIQLNNSAAVTGTLGTGTNTMYPSVGERGAGSNWYAGYIMEWRVYTGSLSAAQQLQVQNFLNSKWGIY